MSGKTILAVLAVLAAGCFGAETSSAQPGCSDENCVRVGSFNIQLLGNGGPGSGHIDAIAKLIADEAKLDLAVLEEININSADWSNLKAALEARGYDAELAGSSGGELKQYVVFIYRTERVTLLNEPSELETGLSATEPGNPACTYDSLRQPLTARFKVGEFDFRLIGVHLKSKRTVDGADPECDDRIRRMQADALLTKLKDLEAESGEAEQDVLIVGDFNDSAESDFLKPFADAGFTTTIEPDALMAGSGEFSYLNSGGERIDHVMLRRDGTSEWVAGSSFILAPDDVDEHKDTISNHVPVWTSFSVEADDD